MIILFKYKKRLNNKMIVPIRCFTCGRVMADIADFYESEKEKLKRSVTMKGKAKPEGFGDKVAERMKQSFTENNPNKREDLKKICPHCGTKSGPSGYARWHGDNCKQL